jgi:hypothetical protein
MSSPDIFEKLTRSAQDAAVRLHVRSALNPLLWLCGICTPAALIVSYFLSGGAQMVVLIVGSFPVLCTCVAYFYLMIADPNRLHSEDYQLRRQALDMIYEKGNKLGILASSVVAITNPETHQLPKDSE